MIRPIRWLLGILGVVLSAALVAGGVVWWAVTTESGTRWLVDTAIGYAELNVDLQGMSGTLWQGLRFEQIDYEDVDRRIELSGIGVQLDWSETSMAQVGISRLAAARLIVVSSSEPTSDPEPLELDLPPLPLRLVANSIELREADVDGTLIDGITIQGVHAEDRDIEVGTAGATIGEYEVQLNSLRAQLRTDLPLSTGFTWRATEKGWSGQGSVDGRLGLLEVEHEFVGEFILRSAGSVDLSNPPEPSFDIVSSFDEWQHENWTVTEGDIRLIGALAEYRAELAASVTDGDLLSTQVNGALTGNESGFTLLDLTAASFDGTARITGTALWSPALRVDLRVVGNNMDLSSLTAGFTTRLDLELQVSATDSDQFSVDLRELGGTYRDQPISATGTLSREEQQWRCQSCDASIGDNRLKASVTANSRQLRGMIDVQAPAMHQLHPDLAGQLQAQGTLRGSIDLPILSGSASASDLVVPGWSIASARLRTRSATTERVEAEIDVAGLVGDGVTLGGGQFRISGSPDDMEIESSWDVEGNSIQVAARLQVEGDTVNGRIADAKIRQRESGVWTLEEPVSLVLTPDRATVEGTLWSNGITRLRTGQLVRGSEGLAVEIELTDAPLEWLAVHAPEEVDVDGFVDAFARLRQSDDEWSGRFDWRQRATVLHITLIDGDVFEVAVPTALAQARFEASGASLRAQVEADGGVVVDLSATANGLTADAVIEGRLNASGQEFGWIAAFIPGIDEVIGSVQANFTARGRANDPQLRGELRLTDGEIVLPAFNVPLTNIQARLTATSSDSLNVTGSAQAGDGNLTIDGSIRDVISADPQLEIEVSGSEATVLDWPDYVLVASPDLSLSGDGNQYEVDGRVRMDRAEIIVRQLPEGAVTPSTEVSVVGREESDARASRLSGSVEIELSERVHVQAFGLDTNLAGELRIALPPGRDPRANGELSLVGGFFEMYGQRLEVERGTMLFSGPLDNPFVDVRVIREIDSSEGDVVVGVDITGRADSLVSTLYSNPAMSESEILSYLVTGRPLGQASSVDGQMISDAAFALGLRQAGIITNQVGQAIGLDELVLEGTNQDTAALVAGKQVTPNLFARYRYGVFSSLGELLLRYSLSDSVSIEVGAGEFQSVDVQYTIERD